MRMRRKPEPPRGPRNLKAGGFTTGLWRLEERSKRQDMQPRVTDDDKGEITVTFGGKELRCWSYKDDAERRIKMLAAREYVEGWCDGRRT